MKAAAGLLQLRWAKHFSAAFVRRLVAEPEACSTLDARIAARVKREATREMDLATRSHLRLAATVAETYAALSEGDGGDPLTPMKAAMQSETFLLEMTGRLLNLTEDLSVLESSLSTCSACLGGSFSCAPRRDAHRNLIFVVDRCFFNDYFRQRGTPFLTHVFCHFDNVAFAKSVRGSKIRYRRAGKLSAGADACRFRFEKYASDDRQEAVPSRPAELV